MIRWAPLVRASALTGEGIDEAMELVVDAGRWRRERLPKGPLNDVFQDGRVSRVTYGVLNLTHRKSHEFPEPMKPGRKSR